MAVKPTPYTQIGQQGSSLYYSLLYATTENRQTLLDIFSLSRELESVLYEVTEPSVARMKLAWWRKEVTQMLKQQKVDHPLAVSLQAQLTKYDLLDQNQEPWFGLIEGVELDLAQNRYPDWPSLKTYLNKIGANCSELAVQVLLGTSLAHHVSDYTPFARLAGQFCHYTACIRNIALASSQNRVYWPVSDLRSVHLTIADVLNGQHSLAFDELTQIQTQRAQEILKQAFASLPEQVPTEVRQALIPLFTRLRLNALLLQKIEKNPKALLSEPVSLAPIKKLWTAYRIKSNKAKYIRQYR